MIKNLRNEGVIILSHQTLKELSLKIGDVVDVEFCKVGDKDAEDN